MNIYSVEFDPLWAVPHGLIIAANNIEEAKEMAVNALNGQEIYSIMECDIGKPGIIFFENGDY